MRWSSTLVLASCLYAVAAGPADAGSMRGTVREASTLAPIPGAHVAIYVLNPDSLQIWTFCDGSGAYLLSDIPPGNEIYFLVCQQSGYSAYQARLQDPGPGEVVFDILLEVAPPPPPPPPPGDPDTSRVSGRVLEWGSFAPLENASVTLRAAGNEYVGHTDVEGRYSVPVASGVYSVTVEAGGYEPLSASGIEAGAGGCTYYATLQPSTVSVPVSTGQGPIVLQGARPNPFLRTAVIHFSIAEPGWVELTVHDVLGRQVWALAAEWMDAGAHSVPFAASWLPAGTYFCRLRAGGRVASAAMTSLR